jgi:hypothetical protein
VACGAGWSAIGIARASANVRVDGLDLDGHRSIWRGRTWRRSGSRTASR